MNHTELFRTYLAPLRQQKAEEVHLRDWNISVFGQAEAIRETVKNFSEAESIEIHILVLYENTDTVAGELQCRLRIASLVSLIRSPLDFS